MHALQDVSNSPQKNRSPKKRGLKRKRSGSPTPEPHTSSVRFNPAEIIAPSANTVHEINCDVHPHSSEKTTTQSPRKPPTVVPFVKRPTVPQIYGDRFVPPRDNFKPALSFSFATGPPKTPLPSKVYVDPMKGKSTSFIHA